MENLCEDNSDYHDFFMEDDQEVDTPAPKKSTARNKKQAKPKVQSEWTDGDIFKLINCVECVPFLWNVMDEKYRNRVERQTAWKTMAEIDFDMKHSDNELQAKWSNVRIQYRSYLAKSLKTKSGQGTSQGVKWKFFDAMEFVGRAEQEQTSASISNVVITNESLMSKQNIDDSTNESSGHLSIPIVKRGRLSGSSSATATSTSAANIVAEGMKSAVAQLKEHRQQKVEDELDMFGKYMANELRCLSDPQAARRVRFKLMRCLMDAIEAENSNKEVIFVDPDSIINLNAAKEQ